MSIILICCAIYLKQWWLKPPKIKLPHIPLYDVIYPQVWGPHWDISNTPETIYIYIYGSPIGFHWNWCFCRLLNHSVEFSRDPPLQSRAVEVALTWHTAAVPGWEKLALVALLALQAAITESARDVSGPKKKVCVLFLLDSTLHWTSRAAMVATKSVTECGLTKILSQRQGLVQMGTS